MPAIRSTIGNLKDADGSVANGDADMVDFLNSFFSSTFVSESKHYPRSA